MIESFRKSLFVGQDLTRVQHVPAPATTDRWRSARVAAIARGLFELPVVTLLQVCSRD